MSDDRKMAEDFANRRIRLLEARCAEMYKLLLEFAARGHSMEREQRARALLKRIEGGE